jgi:hypothetical protein
MADPIQVEAPAEKDRQIEQDRVPDRTPRAAPGSTISSALGLSFRHCPATLDVPASERRSRRRVALPAGRDDGIDQAAQAMRDEEMLAEIEDFLEGFNQPTYRGMRINGQRSLPGHPSTGGLATVGPMLSGSNNPLRSLWT